MARKVKLTEGDLIAALLAEHEHPFLLPDDITAERMAARSTQHSAEFWRKVLNKRKDLIKETCINPDTGRPMIAYRPKPK